MNPKRIPPRRAAPSGKEGTAATLPVGKAFVLQFSNATRSGTGTFSGRVEHMRSGRRARFESEQELLAILGKMLDHLGESSL